MDDAAVLASCREGDTAAFAALVAHHRSHVWAVCLQITGNRHDAEDALQDTLLAAWRNLHRFRGDSRFGTWLHRIAANSALAVIRRRKETVTAEPDELELIDAAPLSADRVADIDAVRRALATLPEDFRVAIVLREFADMSYTEIAAHQNIPVQTVKSRINRARQRLLTQLSPT
ncbi:MULTISPECIES: sigma-70 family RNA polymerase sigma factor [unclassified Rhodococcus (in: high G+C Gram-positive bacteria)]|uniref:RNA polymerase sigma factor n=1 Tax=unclassified Rhodococcus (in: high G+C Gram-positive bacteria) TaxID=192944 RepID=UPI003393F5C7